QDHAAVRSFVPPSFFVRRQLPASSATTAREYVRIVTVALVPAHSLARGGNAEASRSVRVPGGAMGRAAAGVEAPLMRIHGHDVLEACQNRNWSAPQGVRRAPGQQQHNLYDTAPDTEHHQALLRARAVARRAFEGWRSKAMRSSRCLAREHAARVRRNSLRS